MKNKSLLIGGILVFVGLLIGGYFVMNNPAILSALGFRQQAEQAVANTVEKALMGSGSLECSYEDENGTAFTTYVKNGMVRSNVTNDAYPDQSGSIIVKDGTTYMWNDEYAIMMLQDEDIETEVTQDEVEQSGETIPQFKSQKDLEDEIDQYKANCTKASVSDDMFEPPTDREFVDFNDYIQMMFKQELPVNLDSDSEGTDNFSQEDFQDIIQQYSNQ